MPREARGPAAAPPREAPDDVVLQDVVNGLLARPRRLPSRLFYDALGSALFDAICELPWYGLTRAERRLIGQCGSAIAAAVGDCGLVAELGPGSGEKLAALLPALMTRRVPHVHLVDISRAALDMTARRLTAGLDVRYSTTEGTFEQGLGDLSKLRPTAGRTLVLFLGSNIGNYDPPDALALLTAIHAALGPGDLLLLGTDLVKPEGVLLLAYDDPLGVTAAFNRNVLVRLNRELDADFDPAAFDHRARWVPEASRVEMHLESRRSQEVTIPGADLRIRLGAGETIWTESSYKYEPDLVGRMGRAAGLAPRGQWIDEPDAFALTLFERAG